MLREATKLTKQLTVLDAVDASSAERETCFVYCLSLLSSMVLRKIADLFKKDVRYGSLPTVFLLDITYFPLLCVP